MMNIEDFAFADVPASRLLDACIGSHEAMMRAADLLELLGRRGYAAKLRRKADECQAAIANAKGGA